MECEDPPLKRRICRMCDYELVSIARYRSLFAEKLFSLVVKPCRYTERGCNATILDLTDHERDECVFRNLRCIFWNCDEIVSLQEFKSHIQEENENHYTDLKRTVVNQCQTNGAVNLPRNEIDSPAEKSIKIVKLQMAEDKTFFFIFSACYFHKRCVALVYYLGTPNEAKHFGFQLRLFKEGSDKEINVTGTTASVTESCLFLLTFENSKAFRISFDEIGDFWMDEEFSLLWSVSVYEKKIGQERNKVLKKKKM